MSYMPEFDGEDYLLLTLIVMFVVGFAAALADARGVFS